MEQSSENQYGSKGGETARAIIDRVLNENFKSSPSEPSGEKTIGQMEDEIMRLVQKHVKFLDE